MTEFDDADPGSRPPAPLVVAASLVAVEGLILVLLAVLEAAATTGERRSLGLSTAVFFAAYGALLIAGAIALWRRAGWARGPVLLTQLIALGLAWTLRDQVPVALGLAAVGLITLAGVVHPDTIEALGRNEDPTAPDRTKGAD